jgi:hypothetical protein
LMDCATKEDPMRRAHGATTAPRCMHNNRPHLHLTELYGAAPPCFPALPPARCGT